MSDPRLEVPAISDETIREVAEVSESLRRADEAAAQRARELNAKAESITRDAIYNYALGMDLHLAIKSAALFALGE